MSRAGYFLESRRFSALTRGRTNAADVTSDVVLDGLVLSGTGDRSLPPRRRRRDAVPFARAIG